MDGRSDSVLSSSFESFSLVPSFVSSSSAAERGEEVEEVLGLEEWSLVRK